MQRSSLTLVKLRIYDASNRGPLDVKWRVLDFSVLLNSAL
jgi:hypothetical protein